MKRFGLFLFGIFICIGAYAETTDLKFVVDNETYATKTCTIGGGVDLPPTPTKTGYDFDGWQPVFYRGTFATWGNIPTAASGYLMDTNGSNVPKENDYIIVNDASAAPEYGENIEIQVSTTSYGKWSQYCRTYIDGVNYSCYGTVFGGNMSISDHVVYDGSWSTIWKSDTKDIVYQGTKYTSGNNFLILSQKDINNGTYYAKFINSYPYSGKWLLRYHGGWSKYGRGGWVAEKQLD